MFNTVVPPYYYRIKKKKNVKFVYESNIKFEKCLSIYTDEWYSSFLFRRKLSRQFFCIYLFIFITLQSAVSIFFRKVIFPSCNLSLVFSQMFMLSSCLFFFHSLWRYLFRKKKPRWAEVLYEIRVVNVNCQS